MKINFLIISTLFIFFLSNTEKSVKSGYIVCDLIDDNNIYYINNLSFVDGNRKRYKINITQVFTSEQNDPYSKDNFKYLNKVRFYRKGVEDKEDSFYFAKVKLITKYFNLHSTKEKYTESFFFNEKYLKFKFKYLTTAEIIYN
jgi:hypothetical protein